MSTVYFKPDLFSPPERLQLEHTTVSNLLDLARRNNEIPKFLNSVLEVKVSCVSFDRHIGAEGIARFSCIATDVHVVPGGRSGKIFIKAWCDDALELVKYIKDGDCIFVWDGLFRSDSRSLVSC